MGQQLSVIVRARFTALSPKACAVLAAGLLAAFGQLRDARSATALREGVCMTREEGQARVCARYSRDDSKCQEQGSTFYGFVADSCVITDDVPVIPEIAALKNGETIPPEISEQADPLVIARNLINRFHVRYEKPEVKDEDFLTPRFEYYANHELHMAFSDKFAEAIARSGFLNTHQTGGTSGGCQNCQNDRWQMEKTVIGLSLAWGSAANKTVLPKYAYVVPLFPSVKDGPTRYVSAYGNVIAVLRDEVKKRTTLTPCNPLNEASKIWGECQPQTFYASYVDDPGLPNSLGEYMVAQVWGPLDYRNVRHFLVNCPELEAVSKRRIAALAKLSGLPVYGCARVDRVVSPGVVSHRFVRTQLLAGKAAPDSFAIPEIKVLSATYGGNLSGIAADNVVDRAAKYCNGKTQCNYDVLPKFLGDVAPDKPKRFEIRWQCPGHPADSDRVRELRIPAPADGTQFGIDCSARNDFAYIQGDPRSVQLLSATYGGQDISDLLKEPCGKGGETCEAVFDRQSSAKKTKAARRLKIEWRCTEDPEEKVRRIVKQSPKNGIPLRLSCEDSL
jgi:hypothetical protein